MPTKKKFTEEEMILLGNNPNIAFVSPTRLSYTVDFKKKAVENSKIKGMTAVKIFEQAGLSVEVLGKTRITAALKSFKKEAVSPTGFHEPRGKSIEAQMEAFAKEDFSKKQAKVAIRELQEKVVHLEQQIEFLKKTRFPKP